MNDDIFTDIDADINLINQIYPDIHSDNISQYYSTNQFKNINSNEVNDFSLLCYNIRSLNANYDQFEIFLGDLDYSFSALVLTESWLSNDISHLFKFNNYSSHHSLRQPDKRGGGVSAFINDKFVSKTIDSCTINLPFIESLFINITYKNQNVILACVYRPPNGDIKLFTEKLMQMIQSCNLPNYDNFILCGDFNIDLLKFDSDSNVSSFLNSCRSLSLVPLISKPTRITESSESVIHNNSIINSSATLIDNILMSNPSNVISGLIYCDITDHLPVFSINRSAFNDENDPNPNKTIKYRLINETTINNMRDMISSHDFTNIINCENPDDAIENFARTIERIYKLCCPLKSKTISYKHKLKPWISHEIKQNIKKRHKLSLLNKLNRINRQTYTSFRNFVTNQIRKAKQDYYDRLFNNFKGNCKATWKAISNLLKPKTNMKNSTNDDPTANKILADEFNNHFSNIGKLISEKINNRNGINFKNYLSDLNFVNSFYFSPTTNNEIRSIIYSLKNKKNNIHTISVNILKNLSDVISPILCKLINKSLASGYFPESLKVARVTPLPKVTNPASKDDYRGISILPLLSKIYEKVTHIQVNKYCTKYNIIFKDQYGFQSKKSTSNAIINQMQYLYKTIDEGNLVFSIFLDFKKAFDCVDHEILLSKLFAYGIRGVAHDWFRSYLSERKQFVVINNSQSESTPITHGVPQGSILGPLLFILFINDLPKSSTLFKYVLFADDSTLSCSIPQSDPDRTASLINNELSNVNNWLNANKICLNGDKTKYIIFSYKKSIELPTIKIGENDIQQTQYTKFLGVLFDQHLTFNEHINYVSAKISKSIGILYKLNKYLPQNILTTLYLTLVQPYLTYGIVAWHGTSINLINKLFILQKKAIRAVNFLPYNSHTNDYFKEMRILKLSDLFKMQTSQYIFKTLHSNNDDELHANLLKHSDIHNYNTRGADKFNIPKYNKSKSQCNIDFSGTKIWNSLPVNIKNSKTISEFSKEIKNLLISAY